MKIQHLKLNEENLFFWIGVFSTMTALSFAGITLFYWIMLVTIVYKLIKNKGKFYLSHNKIVLVFTLIMVISCVISLFNDNMQQYWVNDNVKKTVTFLIFFLLMSLLFNSNSKNRIVFSFLQGLYVSTVCQLIWGILQFVLWYSAHIELNKLLFSDILGMNLTNSTWSFIYQSGTLRLTGISWEPAYFSLAMVTGFILAQKPMMKLAFVALCLLSTSRTGIILIAIAIILDSGILSFAKKISKKKLKKVGQMIFLSIIAIILIFVSSSKAREIVSEAWNSLVYWNSTISGGTHFNYIRYIPYIFKKSPLINKLFGYGIVSGGYPYMIFYNLEFGAFQTSWSPESDFINMLWGSGILGVISYYYLLIRSAFFSKNKNVRFILICALVGGVFYIYYGTWVMLLMIIGFQTNKKQVDKIDSKDIIYLNSRRVI